MSEPYFADPQITLHHGDSLAVLRTLPDASVNCCVTSPPYFGLRDYGEPGQYGLESSPAEYVETMRALFAEVRRVLADDGTFWLNLGSSYANSSAGGTQGATGQRASRTFTAAGSGGFVASASRHDALPGGTTDTGRSGCSEPDCAYSDLCGGCVDARSSRTADSTQPPPCGGAPPSQTSRGSEPGDSAATPRPVSLGGAHPSTIQRCAGRPQATCSHCRNCGVCLAVLGSSSRDARLCGRRETYIGGTSSRGSADRSPGTDALGTAWLNYTAALVPKSLIPVPWMVAMSLQTDGWILRNDIIWAKPNAMPESVTDRLSTRHEHLFMFSKARTYWFDLDPIREPSVTPDRYAASALSWNRGTKEADVPGQSMRQHRTDRAGYQTPGRWADGSGGRHQDSGANGLGLAPGGRNPGDVWTVATQPFAEAHFAVMPQALAERAILAGCKPGGVVLDPFSGSGTTGLAATKHGRKYIGIDLSRDYLDLSLRTRLSQPGLDLIAEEPA